MPEVVEVEVVTHQEIVENLPVEMAVVETQELHRAMLMVM